MSFFLHFLFSATGPCGPLRTSAGPWGGKKVYGEVKWKLWRTYAMGWLIRKFSPLFSFVLFANQTELKSHSLISIITFHVGYLDILNGISYSAFATLSLLIKCRDFSGFLRAIPSSHLLSYIASINRILIRIKFALM